jgi:hypothetical protein
MKVYEANKTVPLGENVALRLYGRTTGQSSDIGAALHVAQPDGGLNVSIGTDYSNRGGMSTTATVGVGLPINQKLTANGELGMTHSNLFGPSQHAAAAVVYKPDRDFSFSVNARRDYFPGYRPQDSFGAQVKWDLW